MKTEGGEEGDSGGSRPHTNNAIYIHRYKCMSTSI